MSEETTQTIIKLIFAALIPTIAVFVLTLPLWLWKKVHNESIFWIGLIILIVPYILVYNLADEESKWVTWVIVGLTAIPNLIGFSFFKKRLNLNRCPECHTIGQHLEDHDRETLTTTKTTWWSDGSKTKDVSHDHTNYYYMKCKFCGHQWEWNDRNKN